MPDLREGLIVIVIVGILFCPLIAIGMYAVGLFVGNFIFWILGW